MAEKTNDEKSSPVEQQRLEQEQIEDLGSIWRTRGKHAIHCLTVVGGGGPCRSAPGPENHQI